MTLCLIALATDGFLAIADGRRARLTLKPGVYEWISDDDAKVVVVPNLPVVALTAGRASFNQKPNAAVLAELFARLDVPVESPVLAIAEACRSEFTTLDRAYPDLNEVGTTTIVAGYEPSGTFAAFRVDVPRKTMNPGTIDEIRLDLAPVHLDLALPVLANPAESEAGMDVVAAFDKYFDDVDSDEYGSGGIAAQYRFAGRKLDEMRANVLDLLKDWLREKPDIVAADGIGGRWLVASVTPGLPVVMGTPIALGPLGGHQG